MIATSYIEVEMLSVWLVVMDPSLNETEVMNDFLQGWYGPKGAPVITAYMQAFYNSALATNTYLSIFLGVAPAGTAPGAETPPNLGRRCAKRRQRICAHPAVRLVEIAPAHAHRASQAAHATSVRATRKGQCAPATLGTPQTAVTPVLATTSAHSSSLKRQPTCLRL